MNDVPGSGLATDRGVLTQVGLRPGGYVRQSFTAVAAIHLHRNRPNSVDTRY